METIVERKTALLNQVHKKIRMDLWDIVKFQLMMHCYLNNSDIPSKLELDCFTLLAINPNVELGQFCNIAVIEEISESLQSIRNLLAKLEKRGLITKIGKSKKRININPAIVIQMSGNILLNYNILRIDIKEGKSADI